MVQALGGFVKIDCISDLHGFFPVLDGGDLLIVAGDLTARDTFEEHNKFFCWLAKQDYKKKIFIGGNHDNMLEHLDDDVVIYLRETLGLRSEHAEYLFDSGTEFQGFKIWGSPWTSQFPNINPKCCAFTYKYKYSIKERWDMIPDDVDILVTHCPPFTILDQINRAFGANVGDIELLHTLEKRIKPKLHVFGHIHEQGAKQIVFKRPGFGDENNTICVNACIVNERYRHVNGVQTITLGGKSVSPEEENARD